MHKCITTSTIFTFLHPFLIKVINFACHLFIYVGRRHKTSGAETKVVITPGTTSNMTSANLCWFFLPSKSQGVEGAPQRAQADAYTYNSFQERSTEPGKPATLQQAVKKPTLCRPGRQYLSPQWLLQIQPWEMAWW
jgi:hypothetical protein